MRSVRCPRWTIGVLLAACAPPLRGAGLGLARSARAGPPGGGPARRGRGRFHAPELPNPRPRVRLLPGAGRRGAHRAAPAGEGGRAGRGSVLAGPQPQQAGGARLARRGVPSHRHRVPPRSPRHRHQQLRRPHPDRRGRRGARRDPPALPGRPGRLPVRARRLAHDPHRRRRGHACARCRSGPAPSRCRSWSARCTSTARPRSWCASASASPRPPTSTASSRTSRSCWRTRRFEKRWWLPYRQEIEIRRRASFFDFPARGIIRGRWEIADYDLNVGMPPAVLAGPAIGGLTRPRPDDSALGRAAVRGDRGRGRAGQPAGHGRAPGRGRAHRRIPGPGRPALESARDRVAERSRAGQPGAGARARLRRGARHSGEPDPAAAADRLRDLGRPGHRRAHACSPGTGATQLSLGAERQIRDLRRLARDLARAQLPARRRKPGDDYGDYVLLDSGDRRASGTGSSGRTSLSLELGVEESRSVGVESSPANGTLPAQSAARRRDVPRRAGRRRAGERRHRRAAGPPGAPRARGRRGGGESTCGRPRRAAGSPERGPGPTAHPRLRSASGTDRLPAYRSFVLGGRGTLVGSRSGPTGAGPRRWRTWSGGSRCRSRRSRWGRSPAPGAISRWRRSWPPDGRTGRSRGCRRGGHRRRPAGRRNRPRVAHAPHSARGGRGAPDGTWGSAST